jgi:ferric-dicitrate binding protein FerR (iron transport regulator)
MLQQPDKRKQELWKQILLKQKKQVHLRYFRYAASLLLLIGIGSIGFYLTTQRHVDEVIVSDAPPDNDAMLILANGEKVKITSKQSTVQYSTDGSGIVVNDSSAIVQPVSDKGLNQLIVPYGKRSFIVLSEGTKVWLNSGSKLIFPSVFNEKSREVILEGEAFFDVAKNKEKPFYVKTEAFKMKVYGTKFNVQAYLQDNDCQIVLVEGKVGMNVGEGIRSPEVFLAPNQKATISKGEEKFDITNVENTEIYTAWIDGYLTFTNEDVSDLLKRVSRYYNVEIDTELPENIEKIYGKLDLKDDLGRVLDGIAFISKTKYKKDGNKYVFYE